MGFSYFGLFKKILNPKGYVKGKKKPLGTKIIKNRIKKRKMLKQAIPVKKVKKKGK